MAWAQKANGLRSREKSARFRDRYVFIISQARKKRAQTETNTNNRRMIRDEAAQMWIGGERERERESGTEG